MPSGDTVLVLTGPDDPTADAVINALVTHPVRVARIDTGDFPASIGHRPYGVAIHADSPAAHVDWRADYGALHYSPIEPPAEVTAAMGRYLDLFGLSFGAFDFGVTGDGQWLAYECNPSAQWLWLEHQTGIGISTALAGFLAAGATG